ncbi:Nn.00g020780.m01.CDS01 [Neocucurbitaria sp. VM-36]
MPMTAVIKVSDSGSLQQIQIGAADIVATLAAAHSAWGWIGGLTGISSILRLCQRKDDLDRMREVFQYIEPDHASCQVLGQHGLVPVTLAEHGNVFGDTPGSQIVGTTLCAMGHIMEPRSAVRIFQDFFLDKLFRNSFAEYPGSRETLCTFLADNYQSILNEGTVHRLNDQFDDTIAKVGLTQPSKPSNHPHLKEDVSSRTLTEKVMIKGFLRWLLQRGNLSTYYTRSATVARLATCMKCIGYKISNIRMWDGLGTRPTPYRGLILVTGGAYDTDSMVEDESPSWAVDFINHYHWETVGAMLWNSLAHTGCESFYETFQQDFEDVDVLVKNSLKGFYWACVNDPDEVQAFPIWKTETPRPASRIAMRLASVHFPGIPDLIAPFYEKIATEQYMVATKSSREPVVLSAQGESSKEIQRFRALSASICISMLSRVAGPKFHLLKHSTMIDLSESLNRTGDIVRLCTQVQSILQGGATMSTVITAIAVIHCAADLAKISDPWFMSGTELEPSGTNDSITIGWRNGRYAILPALLFSLDRPLEKSCLGLQCADGFIANLPTQRDGAIRTPFGLWRTIFFTSDPSMEAINNHNPDPEKAQSTIEAGNSIFLGPPSPRTADKPLYINLERPSHTFGEPLVSLCGRLGGDSLGHVSIQDVLRTLALSWSDANGQDYPFCAKGNSHTQQKGSGQDLIAADSVFNMPASRYCRDLQVAPRDNAESSSRHNIYVQIKGNTPWTIFLAGQSPLHNRVVFGCTQCAIHTGIDYMPDMRGGFTTLLGYT